jgi:hypothetical protein
MTLVSLDDTEYVDMSAAQRGLDRTLISQNPRLVHNCVRPTHPCHTRLHVLATIIKINEINQHFRGIAYGARLATMVGESFEVTLTCPLLQHVGDWGNGTRVICLRGWMAGSTKSFVILRKAIAAGGVFLPPVSTPQASQSMGSTHGTTIT